MKTVKEIKSHIKEIESGELQLEGLSNKYPFVYINNLKDLSKTIASFKKNEEKEMLTKMFQEIIINYEANLSSKDWTYLRTEKELNDDKDYLLAIKFILGA